MIQSPKIKRGTN